VEIGAGQGAKVTEMATAVRGLSGVGVLKDYAGLDRILVAGREREC
jgi:methylase of polypeptide subunit release factors